MVIFEVVTRQARFESVPENVVMGRILKGERPKYPSESLKADLPGLDEITERCWVEDPRTRPNGDELLEQVNRVFLSFMLLSDS